MEINNTESAQRFVGAARALVGESLSAAHSTHRFSIENMLDVADVFGIHGVFHSDGQHARLVLRINPDGTIVVYDPLYHATGDHIYRFRPDHTSVKRSITVPSRPLQGQFAIFSDLFVPEHQRHRILRERGYALNLPSSFRRLRLQYDYYNCGPLVLYAALVGTNEAAAYRGSLDLSRLREMSGIVLV